MLVTVNDTKTFIEKTPGDLVIYTAGNSAYWVGHYLKKSNIPFVCYVDETLAAKEGELYNGVPIFYPRVLECWAGRKVRLITPVTPPPYAVAFE